MADNGLVRPRRYVGIFRGTDIRERSRFRAEESDMVEAYSHKAATHKLLYRDRWVLLADKGWTLVHEPIIRKYDLAEVVQLP